MCGIAGIVDFDARVDEQTLGRMCNAMEHRGPDAEGRFVESGVALGMRRLSVIDIEGGDQPIFSEDENVVVILNGEIYNFKELRADLRRRGHSFSSGADTEVLVHLYEEYGPGLVDHLRGMFCFALWDRRRRRLLLARDRVGKKPLFYAVTGGRISFASELRALLQDAAIAREVQPDALDAYLALQYVPDPWSAISGVRKLPPATVLQFDANGVRATRYWRLQYEPKDEPVDAREKADELWQLLLEATRLRLISDVPVGAFLSGGIDSSAVVAAMSELHGDRVRTFSIAFDEAQYDESAYARMVAQHFGTEHEEFRLRPDALAILPKLARHYGEPFADPSAIPSFALAELTRRHVTVALTGDGGDESFAGYGRHALAMRLRSVDRVPQGLRRAVASGTAVAAFGAGQGSRRARARRLSAALAAPAWERYARGMSAWGAADRAALLTPAFAESLRGPTPEEIYQRVWDGSPSSDPLDRVLDVDLETYLPGDLLVKVDIASMAYSLEARSPFLDHRLVEWAARLPASLKLNSGGGKRLLKAALRGKVPDEVLDRPKMGFGVPLSEWFRGSLRDLPSELLLDREAVSRRWLRPSVVEQTIREHRSGAVDHGLRLWVLVQLETWAREVLEVPPVTATTT
jgi:asparagine synthase (glutamine-hydrolysing)